MAELVPAMTVPAVCTPNLPRLLARYRDQLGFRVVQDMHPVLALAELGPVRLQLWQRAGKFPGDYRALLDSRDANVFQSMSSWRQARSALREEAPRLRTWSAWEFSLIDTEGNRLLNQPDEDPKPSLGWTWYDTRLPTRLTDFESIQAGFIHGGA